MKKQLTTLLTLLIAVCSGAWGDTYTDQASTVTWAFTSHESLTSTNSPTDAFLSTNLTVGSNLNLSSVTKSGRNNSWGTTYNMVMIKPTTAVAKNAGESADNTLTFTVTPAQGITFTPTKISFTGCNAGSTGDPQTSAYVTYSDNTTESLMSKVNMNRDDKDDVTSPYQLDATLSNAKAGKIVLKIYMEGLTNTGKGVAFTNIVVTGTVSGTPVASTTYDLTVNSNDASLGTVTGSGTYAENEEVTLTATAKESGYFIKWQKDGADFSGNTSTSIDVTVTADATYTAIFGTYYSVTYNVSSDYKGTSPVGFSTEYADGSNKWTAPVNYYTASEGLTLTKWNDGTNDYVPGTEYTLTGNISITPVFENTGSLSDITAETTISWPFGTDDGAPTLTAEGNTQYYVQRATIAGNTVDVPIFVNTIKNYGINGKTGKFNNTSNSAYAQVNNGTVFKIPAIKGMVVTYSTNQTSAVTNIGFTDDASNLGGDGSSLTNPTEISSDNKTITYTYTGTANYLYLVDINGGKYPTGLTVTYPARQSVYATPTITVGEFNFANKGYAVTITASEGSLQVSTDGTSYETQTSPYVTYATTTTTYYAKATGNDYDASEVAEQTVTNTFDSSKSYVAWVYTKGYGVTNYAFTTDPMVTALQSIYNVVEVNYAETVTPSEDLSNADLIVCSEAMAGNKTMSNGMKVFAGQTPMISLKFFNYTSGRWGWGTPANPSTTTLDFTPNSTLYKVLDGVTYESDGTIKLATQSYNTGSQKNVVQTVSEWTDSAPSDNVNMGTADEKVAMHCATKYFGLGLSSDCWQYYTDNAKTIVKNAAAMLIAGEALNTEVEAVSATIASSGYTSLSSSYALDFSGVEGLTAFVVTKATSDGVTLSSVEEAPAETGLVLTGTAGETYSIPVVASASDPATNLLSAAVTATVVEDNEAYILKGGVFCLLTGTADEAARTIPAGKAYLPAAKVTTGKGALTFAFEDEAATGIVNAKVEKNRNADGYYDLAGQRVSQPVKGLYIKDSKKYVVK